MSVFLLPHELCTDLEMLMCKFWWKSSSKKDKGIHWMRWERMSIKKSEGGLGFRNLRDFNVALLGKQGWRLILFPQSLVSRVFRACYYPNYTFLNAELGNNPSYIWRSVMESQSLLKRGMARRIGDGNNVKVLAEPWLPNEDDPYVHTVNEALEGVMVSSLMVETGDQWDIDLINDIFVARDVNLILSIPLQPTASDSWYWRKEKKGQYLVKSAYYLLQDLKGVYQTNVNSGFWRKLWNLKIPPKVKNFLWRAVQNCLPIKDLLRTK